jgi:hypothetical protein
MELVRFEDPGSGLNILINKAHILYVGSSDGKTSHVWLPGNVKITMHINLDKIQEVLNQYDL